VVERRDLNISNLFCKFLGIEAYLNYYGPPIII
jgi:hypothetical protein